MSTHNISFCQEIRKYQHFSVEKATYLDLICHHRFLSTIKLFELKYLIHVMQRKNIKSSLFYFKACNYVVTAFVKRGIQMDIFLISPLKIHVVGTH